MRTLQDLFKWVIEFMNSIVVFLISLALVGFLWGIFKYFLQGSNAAKREDSKQFMIYGILSIFVITSFWGLIVLMGATFGIQIGPKNENFIQLTKEEQEIIDKNKLLESTWDSGLEITPEEQEIIDKNNLLESSTDSGLELTPEEQEIIDRNQLLESSVDSGVDSDKDTSENEAWWTEESGETLDSGVKDNTDVSENEAWYKKNIFDIIRNIFR